MADGSAASSRSSPERTAELAERRVFGDNVVDLANNTPVLILLDYSMPVTSGPQVLEMIRSEPTTAHIPVIFLTGKDDSESVNRVLELKPDGHILKSIGRESLLERLDEFFANRA